MLGGADERLSTNGMRLPPGAILTNALPPLRQARPPWASFGQPRPWIAWFAVTKSSELLNKFERMRRHFPLLSIAGTCAITKGSTAAICRRVVVVARCQVFHPPVHGEATTLRQRGEPHNLVSSSLSGRCWLAVYLESAYAGGRRSPLAPGSPPNASITARPFDTMQRRQSSIDKGHPPAPCKKAAPAMEQRRSNLSTNGRRLQEPCLRCSPPHDHLLLGTHKQVVVVVVVVRADSAGVSLRSQPKRRNASAEKHAAAQGLDTAAEHD